MNNASLTRVPTAILKAVVILIGIGTLAFLLWEPHVEGVNAHATTLYQVYFDDPFLAFAYIASIPFFVALYQAFTLLGYIGRHEVFAQPSVKALRTIKQCAMAMIVLIVIGVVWLLSGESDDRPPIIAMGTLATVISVVIATAASVFERTLQHAVALKSENDLTV